jgi:primosomal protein N'
MKQKLNEQFTRMQKLAGIITENQINKESNSLDRMLKLLKLVLDDSHKMLADKSEDKDFIIDYLQNTIKGVLNVMKDSNRTNENQIQEMDMDVKTILTNNGIDDDYFESMDGKAIETGTEEWLDVLSDVTGKDAYTAEFDEEDEAKIQAFMQKLEALGIELI